MKNQTKILHVGNQAFGFACFMLEHFKYIKECGHEVILGFNKEFNPLFTDKILAQGYTVHDLSFIPGKYSLINFLNIFLDCLKLFRSEKFDIVVVHFPVVSIFIRIAAKLCGIKNIVYFQHALSFNCQSKPITRAIMPIIEGILNRFFTDYLICINPEDKNTLLRRKLVQKNKIFYLNSLGVDPQHFTNLSNDKKQMLLNNLNIPDDAVIIGTACRIIHQKGVYELLDAAENLIKKSGKNIYCIIVGDGGNGSDLKKLKKLALEKGISDKIIFTGFTTNAKDYISLMNIFVLPTYYPEGMPISILEAMSMEKAVIATNIKGCRNIIENNHDGLLIRPKCAKDLYQKIEYLVNNSNERIRLGKNARRTLLNNFSIQKIREQHLTIMENILKPEPEQNQGIQFKFDTKNAIENILNTKKYMKADFLSKNLSVFKKTADNKEINLC